MLPKCSVVACEIIKRFKVIRLRGARGRGRGRARGRGQASEVSAPDDGAARRRGRGRGRARSACDDPARGPVEPLSSSAADATVACGADAASPGPHGRRRNGPVEAAAPSRATSPSLRAQPGAPAAVAAPPPRDSSREAASGQAFASALHAYEHAAGMLVPQEADEDLYSDSIVARTALAWDLVNTTLAEHSHPLRHVAVGAIVLHSLRLVDVTLREHVLVFYLIEGGSNARAHAGIMYTYYNGAWVQFDGVVPEGALARIKKNICYAWRVFSVSWTARVGATMSP